MVKARVVWKKYRFHVEISPEMKIIGHAFPRNPRQGLRHNGADMPDRWVLGFISLPRNAQSGSRLLASVHRIWPSDSEKSRPTLA